MKKIIFALIMLLSISMVQAGLIDRGTLTIGGGGISAEIDAIEAMIDANNGTDPAPELISLGKFDDDTHTWEEEAAPNLGNNGFGEWLTATSFVDSGSSYTIQWDLTSLGFEVWGVVVKNGGSPQNRLYEVNPLGNMRFVQGSTVVTSGASGGQAISHISFIGKRGTPTTPGGNVPDVATGVAYAGIGLVLAVASVRRRRLA